MKIKNWSKFQHFRDRKPPWIKLYRDLLDDLDWHNLDPRAAKTLVMLWLIASENEGELPDEETLAFRLRLSLNQVKTDISRLSQWLIQDDINVISQRYQDDTLETERETEREGESKSNLRAYRIPEDWQPDEESLKFMQSERPDLNSTHVIFKFKSYWIEKHGRDGLKKDWQRTFKNWVLNEKHSAKPASQKTDTAPRQLDSIMKGAL
jgi:hypothetical protein